MSVIEYQHVCMSYPGKTVIEDFNLAIEAGKFVTIIGSSGCGKTTLLKMVNGLIMPTAGEVLINGQSTASMDLTALRRKIGYAIQGSALFPHLTVEKNIGYVPSLIPNQNGKSIKAAIAKWMKIVGLDDDLRKRYPRQLSGGQQQRVGIARALAASPEILLMDEPFSAVDEITRSYLQDEIKRIHAETGITILFVTHDIGEALKLGNLILIVNKGKIQQYDTPEAILKQPANKFVKRLIGQAALDPA